MSVSLAPALPVSRRLLVSGLAVVVGLLFIGSLSAGRAPLALLATFRQVLAHEPSLLGLVLVEIRLPRALLGLMVGATLGLAGAALQGLTRNPLAEPGLIGVSGSAALGPFVFSILGWPGRFRRLCLWAACLGACCGRSTGPAVGGPWGEPAYPDPSGVAVTVWRGR